MKTVTLITGDGIGPEITESVVKIFDAAKVPIKWERGNAGTTTLEESGELIPKSLQASIIRNKIALKGPVSTPIGEGFKSINVTLRQMFQLYANIRPGKSVPGVESPFKNVDLVVVRENLEGLYSGLEFFDEQNGIADSIARVSIKGSERIIRAAFEFARKHKRKTVTIVHKANILKLTSGLFLKVGKRIAAEYPEIECNDRIIDNMCMQLVKYPQSYDVMVTTNLFGDILSDLVAGLVGGLGVIPGGNIGEDISIFEAVHGSAPDIAGQNKANPTALLKSSIMMLRQMDMPDLATKIENALHATLAVKESCTGDLGGKASTTEFTQSIIDNL